MVETIPQLLQSHAARRGGAPAYFVRGSSGWEPTSWADYGAQVRQAGAALVALGVPAGAPVCILGANRPEWSIVHAGAMSAGAVPAGIYATSSPAEVEWLLNHSEASVIVVDSEAQWTKVAEIRDRVPNLRHVVTMKGVRVTDPLVVGWD